ncbi:MAG: beta-lactamase family protein, partial [Bacteroidales bacterium]|nr:beta-lactamase family protein [Bacteroidales bacterium]
ESRPLFLGDCIKRLARLPLLHNPGERFTYGRSTDVLGYLVEVISGMSLDQFFEQRLFEPLGMHDTYFYLTEDKHSRLVQAYTEDSDRKSVKWPDNAFGRFKIYYPLVQGTYFAGGAGLSSTITDYGIFLQMLLNGGEYRGERFLAPRTIELMTTNQIGKLSLGQNKFGLGFELTTDAEQEVLGVTEGSFAWGGIFGTTYWVDPKERLVCQLFIQQRPHSHSEIQNKFKALVYQAIEVQGKENFTCN